MKPIDKWTEENWREQHAELDKNTWHRFRSCQAWYQYFDGWLWVKSYSTLVAGIHGDEVHRRGYYSHTTSTQITRIYNAAQRGTL